MGLKTRESDWFFRCRTENPDQVAAELRQVNPWGSFSLIDRSPFCFEAKTATLERTGLFVTRSRNVLAAVSSPRSVYYLPVPLTGAIRICDGRTTGDVRRIGERDAKALNSVHARRRL